MKIVVEIDTGNAAFSDPSELSRILDDINRRLTVYLSNSNKVDFPVFDINGNKVGRVFSNDERDKQPKD